MTIKPSDADLAARIDDAMDYIADLVTGVSRFTKPFPLEEWDEEDGDVLWWRFPIEEAPFVGRPDDSGFPDPSDAWYPTHWTPLPIPEDPSNDGT